MHTFFSQILPPKSRCALYTEPFAFMFGNLHNNTKSAKSNSFQFYATIRNKSRQKLCPACYITSVHVRQWHQSCNLFTITIKNLLHFLEYFRLVFQWQSKFHEEFSFRLCRSTIYSLILQFFEQMWKDLK